MSTVRTRVTPAARTQLGRAAVVGLGLGVLLPGLVLAQATPAVAHDRLRSQVPADRGQLSAAPREVTLDFGVEVVGLLATVVVRDAQGVDRSEGRTQERAGQVVQPLTGSGGPGSWRIDYRVVSSDGHPITGSSTFTVVEAEPSTGASPSPAASPGPLPPTTSGAAAPPAVPVAAAPARAGSAGPSEGFGPVPVVLLGLAVLSTTAVAVWRVRGRHRPPP